jgi:TRAP-type transport system small permease protein
MDRWLDAVARAIEHLLMLLMIGMVVLVFGNVVLRYAFNSGITLSEELSRWFFIWMTFMGAVLGLKEHGHLGTDVLVSRLKPAARRACLVIAHGLMLWCTWLIFSGSLTQTRINWDVEAPVTGWSMAWVYGAGVVFAVLTAPLLLRDLWRVLSGQLRDDELAMVQDSEELRSLHGPGNAGTGEERRS